LKDTTALLLQQVESGKQIMSNASTAYLRNGRPNSVVFHFQGVRYKLEHRGHRQDSVAVPAEALNDGNISRWIKIGQLEKITRDSFMTLGARTVDILPNEFLAQPMRTSRNGGAGAVPMEKAEADTAGTLTQIKDADVFKTVREGVSPKWGGDLLSTEEELESSEFVNAQTTTNNYPSKNREDTRERGF